MPKAIIIHDGWHKFMEVDERFVRGDTLEIAMMPQFQPFLSLSQAPSNMPVYECIRVQCYKYDPVGDIYYFESGV